MVSSSPFSSHPTFCPRLASLIRRSHSRRARQALLPPSNHCEAKFVTSGPGMTIAAVRIVPSCTFASCASVRSIKPRIVLSESSISPLAAKIHHQNSPDYLLRPSALHPLSKLLLLVTGLILSLEMVRQPSLTSGSIQSSLLLLVPLLSYIQCCIIQVSPMLFCFTCPSLQLCLSLSGVHN